MVFNIIFVLVLLSGYYAYTNHNREFTATASAIQEIWSGSCRLTCRQSDNGLSGLAQTQRQATCLTAQNTGCVCESCPCELVENVLRTCSPATNIYSRSIEFISDMYYDMVKTLIDLYNYLEQVMQDSVSSDRRARLLSLNSGANINFGPKDDVEKEKIGKSTLKPSRSITFKRQSESEEMRNEATTSRTPASVAMNLEVSEQVKPAKGSVQALRIMSDCSRCIEKGKTCMGSCPREKRE